MSTAEPQPNPTPEVGQVWADRDERTVHPELTILRIWDWRSRGVLFAECQRSGGPKVHIRLDRFSDTGSRGYRYIGRSR